MYKFHTALYCHLILVHMTSSLTWPLDSQYIVSYRWSIETNTLSCTVYEILSPKTVKVMTLTFAVTIRHWSRDHSTLHIWFSVGCQFEPTLYLTMLARYLASNILWSWPWPFRVTWRHRLRDHWTRYISFSIGGPLEQPFYLPNELDRTFGVPNLRCKVSSKSSKNCDHKKGDRQTDRQTHIRGWFYLFHAML